MKKIFICVRFHTADKNWDKLIESGTPGQHTKIRDYTGKTGTAGMFEKTRVVYLFRTILSFCSMLTRDFFLRKVADICAVLTIAATGYYQKTNRYKIKIAGKCCSDDIALGFFLCNVVWSLLDNIVQGFYLCNVVAMLSQVY